MQCRRQGIIIILCSLKIPPVIYLHRGYLRPGVDAFRAPLDKINGLHRLVSFCFSRVTGMLAQLLDQRQFSACSIIAKIVSLRIPAAVIR